MINQLLQSLQLQMQRTIAVESIVVYSDASTDATDEVILKHKTMVQLVRSKRRVGKPSLVNRMCQNATTDALIVLDADIVITQTDFLEQLVAPLRQMKADLTSAKVRALPAQTALEKTLAVSMEFKESLFSSYRSGTTVYTCHGRARAFSRRFYQICQIPADVLADDAYSYLLCRKNGFGYAFVPEAVCEYRLPNNLADHEKQSLRFFQGKQQLDTYFGTEQVNQTYRLPLLVVLWAAFLTFLKHPYYFSRYVFIVLMSKIASTKKMSSTSQWPIALSSKKLG